VLNRKFSALKSPTFHILIVVCHAEKRATAQIAHLVFANTQANAEKPKELFFSQRSTEIETELNE